MATHPETQQKLVDEIFRAFDEEKTERVTFEMIQKMPYLDAAVFEALRLYPPADLDVKQCAFDDRLPDGTKVPKGTLVLFDIL